ncbi:hypothetical protein EMCRGX_G002310 [Ephydatia muelleri]
MSNGGSRFHTLTPMYVGFTNTVNSLYNVQEMVYGPNRTTSLKSFRMALINNWGVNMIEPFYDTVDVRVVQTEMWSQKYLAMREHALSLPKFGTPTANSEVNAMAEWLADNMNKIAYDVLYNSPVTELYRGLQKKYDVQGKPFIFQLLTGAGTFENYVSVGAGCGATPDGRLNGQPTASDCSPQPHAQDKPVPKTKLLDIVDSLKPYSERNLHLYIPGGCEVDLVIEEDFPMSSLLEFIDAFVAEKAGSNLVTITCVNKETLANAENEPQKFDLKRAKRRAKYLEVRDDVLESARASYKADQEKKRTAERERYQAEPEKKQTLNASGIMQTQKRNGHQLNAKAIKQSQKRNRPLNASVIKQTQKRNRPLNANVIKQTQKRNGPLKETLLGES